MKRRRKNLKHVGLEQEFTLKNCQSIVSSNQIEIKDAKGENNSLALLPAKFHESGRAVTQQKRERGKGTCEIPLDLVIEILIRLPPKFLIRSKCVSRQWSSLISSRNFCERLFTVTRREQPCLFMCLLDEGWQSLLLPISSEKTCFVVDQDLSIPGIGGFFLNVVRGLMCFSIRRKACIYNPTTRQRLTLPRVKPDIIAEEGQSKDTRYYLGHDPVNDQYKLLCTIQISSDSFVSVKSEHWVFALGAGGSWKKVVLLENYHHHAPSSIGQFINGSVVHYIGWLDTCTCVVVSFDIRSEELTTVLVPHEVSDVVVPAAYMKASLIEYGGKIAVFDHTRLKDKGLVDLWVLEDVGKKKWSKEMSRVLQPCQRHLVHNINLILKGTTKDGKVILAPLELHTPFYILCYDMQSNDLRKVDIKGVPERWFDKKCYFDLKVVNEKSESVVYLET